MIYLEELDDLLEMQEQEDILVLLPRPYTIRNRYNHLNRWNDEEFYSRFRLNKQTVARVLMLIENNLRHRTDRNQAMTPMEQILIALRFFACGSFQTVLGDFSGIHRTTAGKCLKKVASALADLRPMFIYMPRTEEELLAIKESFYQIARFPRVIGAVDCTHIRIQNPGGELAENFRNRKGYFSLNIQVVSDANYKIRDIVCRWPGSSHDSHIFQNSVMRMRFENGKLGRNVLLGDSGYPLRSYLITPIANPRTPAEHMFNESQIKTRIVVERTFEIWKRRFPILSLGMRYKMRTIQNIIVAAAVLQNIARDQNDMLPEELNGEIENNINQYEPIRINNNTFRQPFIDYFQTLL